MVLLLQELLCPYWMYSVTKGEDVKGTEKFCVPWAVNLEQFAINYARQQFVSESVQRAAKDVSSVVDNNKLTNSIRRLWDVLVL